MTGKITQKTVSMKFTRDELWFISEQLQAAATDNYEGEPKQRAIVDRFIRAFFRIDGTVRRLPKRCDCECPEPESGVALVSMDCPIHNLTPQGKRWD